MVFVSAAREPARRVDGGAEAGRLWVERPRAQLTAQHGVRHAGLPAPRDDRGGWFAFGLGRKQESVRLGHVVFGFRPRTFWAPGGVYFRECSTYPWKALARILARPPGK